MLKTIRNAFNRSKEGVAVPEEYYIVPVVMRIGDKEIVLNEDGSIDGDFETFDRWCKNTIVKAFPDERAIMWLLREHWKLIRAMREINGLPPDKKDQLEPTKPFEVSNTEFKSTTIDVMAGVPTMNTFPVPVPPDPAENAPYMSGESLKMDVPADQISVHEQQPFVLEPDPIELVAEAVEPVTKSEKVIIQTENGPKEFIVEFKE